MNPDESHLPEGHCTINGLTVKLVMDRTTLGRIVLPLQREGLIAVKIGPSIDAAGNFI